MQQSAIGVNVFRELEGIEASQIFAHDLEQAIINMLATDEFKEKCMEWFSKTGRFGSGKCFPVVQMQARMVVKVFTSVESARSKENMPPPFQLISPEIRTGEMLPEIEHKPSCETVTGDGPDCTCDARSATELVTEAEVTVNRVVGFSVENAVDKARIEVGIQPLVPTRNADGMILNLPGKHAERAQGYAERGEKQSETKRLQRAELLANAKAKVAERRAAREAAEMTEAERLRMAKEGEAREQS